MSRTSKVIAMAYTPSLNASSRPIPRSGPPPANSSMGSLRPRVDRDLGEHVLEGARINRHTAGEGEVEGDDDEEHTTDQGRQGAGQQRLHRDVSLFEEERATDQDAGAE